MKVQFDFPDDVEIDLITDDHENVTGLVLTPTFRKRNGSATVVTGLCKTEAGVSVDTFELSVSGVSGALTKRAPIGKVVPAVDLSSEDSTDDEKQSEDE